MKEIRLVVKFILQEIKHFETLEDHIFQDAWWAKEKDANIPIFTKYYDKG